MLGFIGLLLSISQIGAPLLFVIWGSAAVWLFHNDFDGCGVFMIARGIFVSTVDNLIRPWLIGLGIDMPLSLTVLGVFGGFVAFGFLGLFVGPTLIAIVFTLLMVWRCGRGPSRDGQHAAAGLTASRLEGVAPQAATAWQCVT
jgi:predicted PurR-regulated permease PerM